ncbi:hypothetical protein FA13DRAFT_1732207 [Coprinellus micaceus]|uniref:Uncharacterized protein n=1 Tax=Coprinellus micaceus TaxID=71717 RepID=A0A4Y7TCK9_COPMI|nr:hypothetical protein FA13DRAFT_1732207 [Coprinellus micaceus]
MSDTEESRIEVEDIAADIHEALSGRLTQTRGRMSATDRVQAQLESYGGPFALLFSPTQR